jgi:hypothetical protein
MWLDVGGVGEVNGERDTFVLVDFDFDERTGCWCD